MTTIAYRDGILAADTQMAADDLRCGEASKIMRQGRLLIGFCGKLSNFEAFRSWLVGGMEGRFRSEGGNVFILPPSGPAIVWGDGDYPWRETSDFWALGSGERIAIGAMDAGATAEDAVRAAIRWDTSSGGEVLTLQRP